MKEIETIKKEPNTNSGAEDLNNKILKKNTLQSIGNRADQMEE